MYGSASGHEIANEGEQVMPTVSDEGVVTTQKWQVAEITRPLLSTGEECDKGQLVIYGRSGGLILNLHTQEIRKFQRVDGIYEINMWVPSPELARGGTAASSSWGNPTSGFAWQGRRVSIRRFPATPRMPEMLQSEPANSVEQGSRVSIQFLNP